MKARELLHGAIQQLEQAGCDAPRRDAELLLMETWGISATALIINMIEEVPEVVINAFQTLLQRRLTREPLAYILGYKEFWSHSFDVTSDVLIPRPETEHLIESVLQYYPSQQEPLQLCDIGTGSGCIAVTLALEYLNSQVTACDISGSALSVAQQNAEKLGVSSRVAFYKGDLYQALPTGDMFDVVVSNPPYVSAAEMLGLESELGYEPRHALTDEDTGLTLLEILLRDAHVYLKEEGILVLESGLCGMPETPNTLYKLEDYCDLAGNFRGSVFRKKTIKA